MTTPFLQYRDGANVRLDPFFQSMKAWLSTPDTLAVLRGGKVYLDTEDYGHEETLSPPWGREVIVPGETMWPGTEVDGSYRGLNWLVRSEYKIGNIPSLNPTVPLERLQQLAYEQLVRWAAPSLGMTLVRERVWRARPPQAMPMWDADRDLWWLSSEFRCTATRLT